MINNKDAYKVNKAAVFPKEKIIEYYVEYYGEEYRQQITNRLNNIDVVFVPTDLASFKIREAVKNKFKDYPTVDWEEDAKLTLQILKMFANNNVIASPELLATCSDILTNLGFDMKKILVKSKETGELTIVNSDEKNVFLTIYKHQRLAQK